MQSSKSKSPRVDARRWPQAPIVALLRNWKRLSLPLRAEGVLALKQNGKSNRELAKELKVDEGTIRRLLRIDALPESDKASISMGNSAKKILAEERAKAAADREAKAREAAEMELRRISQNDAERNILIQKYTDALLAWLEQNNLYGPFAERVLFDIEAILRDLNESQVQRSAWDVAVIIERNRPRSLEDLDFWLNPLIAWGVSWIAQGVPRGVIRDRMFRDACKSVLTMIPHSR